MVIHFIVIIYCILNLTNSFIRKGRGGRGGRGAEANSTFKIVFMKIHKVNPKHCSALF